MVKKIFIVEVTESNIAEESLTAGHVLHAVMPVAQRVYTQGGTHECRMESIKVKAYYEE